MILSVTFSKPTKETENLLGKPYVKIRFRKNEAGEYDGEFFTDKQAFQKVYSLTQLEEFIKKNAGTAFKNTVELTDSEEITIMSNRHGEIKTLRRKINASVNAEKIKKISETKLSSFGRRKNYILEEGTQIPFLQSLGVMTKEGKVIAAKYDKFRQINRFLEFIKDIVPDVVKNLEACDESYRNKKRPLRISDFGCGKSYLTFAVYYYLTEILKLDAEITGIDLKKDVIENCTSLASELGYEGLHFYCGDVAAFEEKKSPDIMITLHACDTATDYALNYAVRRNAQAVLSVPCCQHEINLQLEKNRSSGKKEAEGFASILKYGLLRERFSAIATDALRAEFLEQSGYGVQILEFIDMEHTPKNLLIRAVRKNVSTLNSDAVNDSVRKSMQKAKCESQKRTNALLEQLQVSQTLHELLQD